ncbi:MAG TPA: hypothetical protein ENI37_01015, partial [Chloroflexi bacterium]|nr:hypothetical protein [Chloroflexota bacterium]
MTQGIYGYDGLGGYWPGVGQALGRSLNANWCSELGRVFERTLDALELPLFPDLGGRRFVDLILCHGGIPYYCLADFFANMLQPAVTRAYYAGMSAEELIDEWLWHASSRYFTDKPVLRFLEFGGDVAKDFVERCRGMALEYLDSGIVPDAEEVGLPERVVGAYRQWITEQSADQVRRESADRWRLRKPEVLVDPWGEGVILDLPPQQVPATMVHADFAWQVMAGEETYTVPVRVRRTGFDLKTNAESVSLSQPAAMYQVSLLADDQVKRTWRYHGVDDERPLLAFDPDRCTLVSWQHSLPARRLGVLYPARFELQVEGEAKPLEGLPRLPWGWADFCGQIWDLSHATRLTLLRDGEKVLTVALRPDESAQRPHLVGGQLLSPDAPTVRAPVYVGPPPGVRIPLTGRRDLEEELARWRLTVRSKWSAIPEVRATTTLADLRSGLTASEKHVDLPLSLPSLLGEAPCGSFVVRLRGPLGRDAELLLRVVPHLRLSGHETLHLPDAQGNPQPAALRVETSPGDDLECQGEGGECRVRAVERLADNWEYEVEAGPDVTRVELTIVRPLPSGDAVRVPISVPIRRLRWALAGEQVGPSRREWTGRVFKRSVDALLQIQSPHLLVTLPLAEADQIGLELRLLDVDNAELQVEDAASQPGRQRLYRFDLSAFRGTIMASRSPFLRLELNVWNLPGRDDTLRLPVLSLTRTLLVDHVELEPHRVGDRAVLELRWRERIPLTNRHVRFWPLWRPWDPVFEQSIPDGAEGTWTFDVPPGALRSGKYRVEFLVVDPWVSLVAPQRPPKGTPGTADVELISPDRQLQYLNARLQDRGQCFELLLERAFVCYDAGDPQKARADWQWCFEHLDDGTIPQILALVELVQAAGDPATCRALQLKMFAARRIERLRRAHRQGEVSAEYFQRYLDYLPRSGLLHKATCRQLLSVDDETVRLHAVQQLIRRKDALGVDAVLAWVEAATLSDADAIAILRLNAQFSVDYLEERLDNPVALRLLEVLSLELGDRTPIVRPGTWVYTDAGWGRIERIGDPTGKPVRQFISGQTEYRLYVTLRPTVDSEPIEVDL